MQGAMSKKAAATDNDLETLTQLNLGYIRSVNEKDVSWFDTHLAPDFLNTNPDGSLVDRQGFLAQIAKGPGVTDVEAHDVLVRIIHDLAIIHARTSFKTAAGAVGGGRYTDIWLRREAGWTCVAAQVTRFCA